MGSIMLKGGEEILVDDSEYKIALKYKWFLKKKGKRHYPVTLISRKEYGFSKLVFGVSTPMSIFHKNRNSLDYRRDNILICNRSELGHLSGTTDQKASEYHGIYFSAKSKKWTATLVKDSQSKHYCGYNTAYDAAIIADHMAITLYGKCAKRNFPNLTYEEIDKLYNSIQAKYGYDKTEKLSKFMQGRSKKKQSTSKYIGVHWHKDHKEWIAQINNFDKNLYLGGFQNEEDAAIVYDMKAIELHGLTARRNFPKLNEEQIIHRYTYIKENRKNMRGKNQQGIKRTYRGGKLSQYVGVTKDKRSGKWMAQIIYNKKHIHLGRYDNEEDAALAYDEKAKDIYGDNARINFPKEN